jgi:outer membrane immunogenic protein
MRKIAVVFALLSAVDVAWAADLPVAPLRPVVAPVARVYDWTGFYIGVNGGWEFQHISETTTLTLPPGFIGGGSNSSGNSGNAAVAGGQAGFNWQSDWAVIGIEGDFDWSGQSKTQVVAPVTNNSRGPWFATIRGRFGGAFDRWLVYGTAGAAFLDVSQNITATGFGTLFNESRVDVGWTAGAGVESAFTQNWTARAEYLFVDANLSLSGPYAGAGTLSHSGTITRNIIRGGINYKFQ